MTEHDSPARRLRGGVAPVLDAASERARRERIASRVVELSRELSSRSERRRRWALGVALAALLGSASAVLLVWRAGSVPEAVPVAAAPVLELQLLAGRASVRSGGAVVPLAEGSVRLAADAELVTRPDEGAELRLASATEVSVAPASQVSIRRERPSPEVFEERVRLRAGSVALAVPKLGTRGKVLVETEDALVEVHGTRFNVRVVEEPPGVTFTEVTVSEGRVLVRSGGQSRFLGPGESTSTRVAAPPTPSADAAPPDGVESKAPASPRRAERRRPATAPVPPSELAEQNRLVEAAELAQRGGMPTLALERLEQLITRYPDAELAHNARVERFRLLERSGRHAEAVEAARAYVARHPNGFARQEAEHLLDGGAP